MGLTVLQLEGPELTLVDFDFLRRTNYCIYFTVDSIDKLQYMYNDITFDA